VGLGWPPPGGLGLAPPHDLLITRVKNIFELKTRGLSNDVFKVDGTVALKATGVFRARERSLPKWELRFWCAQI
jgi:hypothetical protein